MNAKLVLRCVVVMVLAVTAPSAANARVVPVPNDDSRNPSVGLHASKYKPPRITPRKPAPVGGAEEVSEIQRPRYDSVDTCEVDSRTGAADCTAAGTQTADPDEAELTEGDILTAVQEIGLPRLAVTIQPGDSTLVNARTNFYTDPQAFARSITLLDFDIDLAAQPIRYTWVHGDDTSTATTKPGRPYPDLDVTHRYREPADVVRPRVDVTYRVRYRVDGGAWTTIGQTLTATGPTSELEVDEAAPVLTAR